MHHGARLFFSHFGHHVGPFGLLGHVFFPLFGLSLLGLLIALPFLVWAMTRPSRPVQPVAPAGPALPYDATALQILRERYARGEIDGATFDEQLSHLLRGTAPAASYEAPWETPPEDRPEDQGPSNL